MSANSPPDRGRFESQNPYDSLGEAEAGEQMGSTRKPRKTKKTKYVPWEFSPTIFENSPRAHEGKYLVIETTSGPKLTELSVFTVDAVLNNIAPNYASADKMRDGKILILTKDAKTAKHALTVTEVKGVCYVKVTEHNDLNQVKGSVYCEEIMQENLDELKDRLKNHNVTDVRRVTKMVDGNPVNTPLHILTFSSSKLEETLKVGWRVLKLRKYYPSPLKCTKCLVLGHTKKNCPEEHEYCRRCAKARHEGNCAKVACRNCPDADPPHSSNDAGCPKMMEEKAIIQIKEDMKIPYFKARIEFEKRVQKAAKSAETQQQIQDQQEMYRNRTFAQIATQDSTQQQILKTLELLARKIENLEKHQIDNKEAAITPKRKRRTSTKTTSHTSSSDEYTDVVPTTSRNATKQQQQKSQQHKQQMISQKPNQHGNNKDVTDNIENDSTKNNNNNTIEEVEMIVSNSDNADGYPPAGESTHEAVNPGNEHSNQDYKFKEIKGLYEAIKQQTYTTRQNSQQMQQQRLSQPTSVTTMEYEDDNKAMKRPTVQKNVTLEGKKKKIPKN
jgi:hypothetical protein